MKDIDMDIVTIAFVISIFMFMSMRIMYGYWPWQIHPRLRRKRIVEQELRESFNFEPVPMASGVEPDPTKPPPFHIGSTMGQKPKEDDHFDRPAPPSEP